MSSLIKATQYYSIDDFKKIEAAVVQSMAQAASQTVEDEAAARELEEANNLKDQIIRDAEAYADEQLRMAAEQIAAAQVEAQQQIEAWWNERRQDDERVKNEAREEGWQLGHRQGAEAAAEEVRQEYSAMLAEAKAILEQAYMVKEQIIMEAEPFLVELSSAIAEKIIQKQLTVEPEWITDMAKSVLTRRRERGLITLCVSPTYFSLFQDAKDELLMAIDSQAELQIIPDGTVADHGCVVRSSFGSIDARIDTQLKEVKGVLKQLAFMQEGTSAHE